MKEEVAPYIPMSKARGFTVRFGKEVFVIGENLHIVLHLFILLEATRLRVDIAVVKLFYKTIHGSFSLIFIEKPVRPCRKNVVFSMVFVCVLSGKFYPL